MTLVLSEISDHGVIMASDSAETDPDSSRELCFKSAEKTLYFPKLNVGVSTWGESRIGGRSINTWISEAVRDFIAEQGENPMQCLETLTLFLSSRLDGEFRFDGLTRNSTIRMGLHIGGYNSPDTSCPGLCHVFIDRGDTKFDAQLTRPCLARGGPAFHLRNGLFQAFALMWPALSEVDEAFRNAVRQLHGECCKAPEDPVAVRAEWLGNWVRQLSLVTKTAGMPEYIGKDIRILTFDHTRKVRWFTLPEMVQVTEN